MKGCELRRRVRYKVPGNSNYLGMIVGVLAWSVLVGSQAKVFGEVTHEAKGGFQVTHELEIAAPPAVVYRVLVEEISEWWESSHTWSGDAQNLSLEARAGGVFRERLPEGGSVEHLRVVFVRPAKQLRLTGGLGPLQSLGVSGALTMEFSELDGGKSVMKWVYNVSGETAGGLDRWAGPVNTVLGTQAQRLKAHVEGKTNGRCGR